MLTPKHYRIWAGVGFLLVSMMGSFSARFTPTPFASTYTPYPTYTFYPTYTLYPTYTPYPTATITPTPDTRITLPPPITDAQLETIVREWRVGSRYTHGTGIFTMADLPGWDRQQHGVVEEAYVVFNNLLLSSFVEVGVVEWAGGSSTSAARDWFDEKALAEIWSVYDSFKEVESTDTGDTLTLDYLLTFRQAPYKGEVYLHPMGEHIVMVTIVVPANSPRLLTLLHKLIVPTIVINDDFEGEAA
ncbi:MAG: hypothetical protein HY862_14510 [Chloroflexi bacterium]|nr:hypothetical protein [Chloroflexota bacterium]